MFDAILCDTQHGGIQGSTRCITGALYREAILESVYEGDF